MGVVNPTLPTPGEPRGSEESDVRNALLALLSEFNGNIEASNLADSLRDLFLPVGAMVATARATANDGWLLCNGAAVPRAVYAALFTAIGTTYGAGDGLTTFNLPNLSARVPMGSSGGRPLGEQGGAETHTLTVAQMPAHSHTASAPQMDRIGAAGNTYRGGAAMGSGANDYNPALFSIGILNQGGGGSHNNLQPYTVVNWQIKT